MEGFSKSKLTYSEMEKIAQQLNAASAEMERILTNVKNLFAKVGNEQVWSGTAAAATKDEFDKLSAKFPDFYQAVKECYTYLNTVVANYRAVDNVIINGSSK